MRMKLMSWALSLSIPEQKMNKTQPCPEDVAIKSLFITVCVHGVSVSVRRNDVQSH